MKVTRLAFLSSAGAAAMAAVLPQDVLAAGASGSSPRGPAARRFSRQIGTTFRLVRPDEGPVALVLRHVLDRPGDPQSEQFSLVFAARGGAAVAEGTYTLRHARLGSARMHLVPAGEEPRAALLRADFNLLR